MRLRQQLVRLAEGDFVDRGVNVLAFGMPGTGKTHAMCAITGSCSRALRAVHRIQTGAGYAGRQARPGPAPDAQKLDNFDLLIIDDLGYLPQGGGVGGAVHPDSRALRAPLSGHQSNLVFSEWEKVFANPMATAAAIDRIVHHSVILEFDVPSYRTAVAQNRQAEDASAPAKVIVARQKWLTRQLTSCRTYAVRNQQSEKESKRQNLLTHPARMVDAVQPTLQPVIAPILPIPVLRLPTGLHILL